MTRTLLVDADIVAYRSSAAHERRYDWGDGVTSVAADLDNAKAMAEQFIEEVVAKLKADEVIICLSDEVENFRKDVDPTYKQLRGASVRPQHLYDLKDWLGAEWPSVIRPRMEADDVMGILATEPHEGTRIIVSADKDMQTVPGWLFNPNKDKKARRISPEEAERFLMWQAICGDQTDGYPGCPGAGPAAAELLLDGIGWESFVHTFKSGPRKGAEETRWRELEGMGRWPAIVSAYEKAGKTEADAVVQVNLARILKASDVDGNRIIPWSPKRAAD